jgi:hypothetical protein
MNKAKPTRLWKDQFGGRYFAKTVKELRAQIGMGGCRVSKMYCEMKDGSTYHTGYVIGQHWLTGYTPMRNKP